MDEEVNAEEEEEGEDEVEPKILAGVNGNSESKEDVACLPNSVSECYSDFLFE